MISYYLFIRNKLFYHAFIVFAQCIFSCLSLLYQYHYKLILYSLSLSLSISLIFYLYRPSTNIYLPPIFSRLGKSKLNSLVLKWFKKKPLIYFGYIAFLFLFRAILYEYVKISYISFSQGCGSGSGQISLDPDQVFIFSGSGSGSGFSQDSGKLQKGL